MPECKSNDISMYFMDEPTPSVLCERPTKGLEEIGFPGQAIDFQGIEASDLLHYARLVFGKIIRTSCLSL
jgi:hypothetical protein